MDHQDRGEGGRGCKKSGVGKGPVNILCHKSSSSLCISAYPGYQTLSKRKLRESGTQGNHSSAFQDNLSALKECLQEPLILMTVYM